ncbi:MULTISPECIES: three-helix bundle dimerization domain-containing protein [Corynebacterium]|uniref:Uncharacterized protein n=1 Tax=Corynebacterium timonense TaxID=441500 RepID=A0A1H1VAZ5_9CORY|nr:MULTISPECIES: hypothetical protein [Corynebacterium]WJY68936.1 hypothetical protein CAURIS_10315 [Corynebacterium auris]SDS81823.1 hypothetical protein SAMN04488539_2460 [Corynebacterium timonense]
MTKKTIDFSIIREKALRNIREDLISTWSDRYAENQISDNFDSVLASHREKATVDNFLPVLVEAEMLDRLRSGAL